MTTFSALAKYPAEITILKDSIFPLGDSITIDFKILQFERAVPNESYWPRIKTDSINFQVDSSANWSTIIHENQLPIAIAHQ